MVQMNDGAVTTPVATNSNVPIPTSSGSVKVTGNPGEQITLTPADMGFETARPPSKTTCTATNAAVLTTTEIAAGVSVQSATAARLAVTGNSRGWLVPLALTQLALGLGLLLVHRRRRRRRRRPCTADPPPTGPGRSTTTPSR